VVRKGLETALSPFARFGRVRPFLRHRLTSVFGHIVNDTPNPFTAEIYRPPTVSEFRIALDFLRANFEFVTLDDVVAHFRVGAPLPEYPVFLSFDDGLRETADVIAPILTELGIPATFFLTARALDNRYLFYGHRRSYLLTSVQSAEVLPSTRQSVGALLGLSEPEPALETICQAFRRLSVHKSDDCARLDESAEALGVIWQGVLDAKQPFLTAEQAKALLSDGFSLGAHGTDHTKFAHLNETDRRRDLRRSLDFMAETFGLDNVAFAFPHSHKGVTRHWMTEQLAVDPRLSIFFSTANYAPNDRVMVNRVCFDRPVDAAEPLDMGAILARSFLHSAVHHGGLRRTL
jgi:peptidoglycan/xylan/chitin deacetylase (PgdA/CDA1 family)